MDAVEKKTLSKEEIEMNHQFFFRVEMLASRIVSGMMANQAFNSPGMQQYLQAKKMTLERLAIKSAVNMIEELTQFRAQFEHDQLNPPPPPEETKSNLVDLNGAKL